MKPVAALFLFTMWSAAHADFTIPPFAPGSAEDAAVQSTINAAQGDPSQHRFGEFDFNNVEGTFAFDVGTGLNLFDIVFELNGQAFHVPFGFSSGDTVREVMLKPTADAAGAAGVYIKQNGFRWNSATDMKDRVMTTIRIADMSGAILPALEYHESTFQAQQATFDYDYSANKGAFRLAAAAELNPRALGSNVVEISPSNAMAWSKNVNALNWTEQGQYGDAYFIKTAFQSLTARIALEGPWAVQVLNMFFEVNGHEFYIPFEYHHIDNWNVFRLAAGGGYEFVQDGLVEDSSGQLQRVEATFQVAAANGTVNPVVPIQQVFSPVSGPTFQLVTDTYFGY
jgi:hypothetical protein